MCVGAGKNPRRLTPHGWAACEWHSFATAWESIFQGPSSFYTLLDLYTLIIKYDQILLKNLIPLDHLLQTSQIHLQEAAT